MRTIDMIWMQDNLVHHENLVHPVKVFVSPPHARGVRACLNLDA